MVNKSVIESYTNQTLGLANAPPFVSLLTQIGIKNTLAKSVKILILRVVHITSTRKGINTATVMQKIMELPHI